MRLFILTAALLIPAGSGAVGPRQPDAASSAPVQVTRSLSVKGLGTGQCDNPNFRQAQDNIKLRAVPLGELPPGSMRLAVMREVDGCIEPVIVGQPFGAAAQPRNASPRH